MPYRLTTPADARRAEPWPASVRLVSVDYGKTLGRLWRTRSGRRQWLAALRAVKSQAPSPAASPPRLRVHNLPVRSKVYRELLDAGVDLIGTKELAGAHRVLRALARSGRTDGPPGRVQSAPR